LQYLDFREYLRDFYLHKKKTSGFTYREFAKAAGFSSPNFIKLVIDGKANLLPASTVKLCDAMGLKNSERRYFKHLVSFGQAKTIEAKVGFLEKLKTFHPSVAINGLMDDQFSYFSKWYHPVVRELVSLDMFDGDYGKLASLVNPSITTKEAEASIALLAKLRLIQSDASNHYRVTERFLTSEGMTSGILALRNTQKVMAQLAAAAIDTIPPEDRDISGVSVSIATSSLSAIRDELQRCRRRIFEIAAQDTERDVVYRVNLHLFPVSRCVASGKKALVKDGWNE